MRSIVSEALKYSELKAELDRPNSTNLPYDDFDDFIGQPRIIIVGCGGAGSNTVNLIHHMGVSAETIVLDTDKQHIDMHQADKRVLIGKSLTKWLGGGGDPSVGLRAAEMARPTLEAILEKADIVFIIAGLGGGTGTGSVPVVAKIARELGSVVFPIVICPFESEKGRCKKADDCINYMISQSFPLIIYDNNHLNAFVPHLPFGQAFSVMDSAISQSIKDIIETIISPSLINLNLPDIRAIMNEMGIAQMILAETKQNDRTSTIMKELFNNPLSPVKFRKSKGVLINIIGGPDLTLGEVKHIVTNITNHAHASNEVVFGARVQREMEGKIRVVALITGIQSNFSLKRFRKLWKSYTHKLNSNFEANTY
jgi:cell division protein FtsZ